MTNTSAGSIDGTADRSTSRTTYYGYRRDNRTAPVAVGSSRYRHTRAAQQSQTVAHVEHQRKPTPFTVDVNIDIDMTPMTRTAVLMHPPCIYGASEARQGKAKCFSATRQGVVNAPDETGRRRQERQGLISEPQAGPYLLPVLLLPLLVGFFRCDHRTNGGQQQSTITARVNCFLIFCVLLLYRLTSIREHAAGMATT